MSTSSSIQPAGYNHLTVMDRLSRVHREKLLNEGDLIEWVSECECEYIQDVETMIGFSGLRLAVVSNKILLPCNVYRILKIYTDRHDASSDMDFRRVGRWLYLSTPLQGEQVSHVHIDYYGIRLDEQGYPVILEGHLPAVEAFCVQKMYYEDWLLGRLDGSRWGYIHEDMVNKLRETRTSLRHFTYEDLNRLHFIQYNMVPRIGTMWFAQEDVNGHFINE